MLHNPLLAEQHAQSLHSILKIGDLIVFHAGGHAHAVGKIDLVAAAAHHIGAVRLDGHLVVRSAGAGGHVAVDGGHGTGQGAVGILRQAGDGDLAGVAHVDQRPVVDGDSRHDLKVAVLAGNGGQSGACAEHHAHLVGGVHVDDTGGGSVDVVIVRAGVQGIQLGLDVVNVGLHAGQVGRNRLQGGVVQALHLALVLLHHGLDLLVGVTGGLIGRSVERLLADLALVALVLVVIGLIIDVGLAEVVLVVLNGLEQLLVLGLLLFVDLQLALVAVGLHIDVRALDVGNEVALVDVAALRDVQLGQGAGVAGHDVGFIACLHGADRLAHVGAVILGAPDGQEHQQECHEEDHRIAEGRQLFLHHDAAILQIGKILNGRHNYLVSIKTSSTPSSSS